jgi:hypothetical protein
MGSSSMFHNDPRSYASSSIVLPWTKVDAWVVVPSRVRSDLGTPRPRVVFSKCRTMSRDICDKARPESYSDKDEDRQHRCSVCLEQFSSRNALFRHIRYGHTPGRERNAMSKPTVKYTIALSVGYIRDKVSSSSSSISEFAGYQIQSSIRYALRLLQSTSNFTERAAIVSQTQASVAKSRPKCLGQEHHCASAEDIIIVKIVVSKDFISSDPSSTRRSRKNFLLQHLGSCIPEFLSLSNQGLGPLQSISIPSVNWTECAIVSVNHTVPDAIVQLHGIRILDDDDDIEEEDEQNPFPTASETRAGEFSNAVLYPPSYRKIHAEQSCTQHIYHGLIPVEWLPNSTDIIHWYQTSYHEPVRHLRAPIPNTIRSLKQIFRSMESVEQIRSVVLEDLGRKDATKETDSLYSIESETGTLDDQLSKSSINAAAKGRYGALAYRIPKYWHNYADPSLRISPNYDPAYRVIDRARIVDFVWINATNSDDISEVNRFGRLYVVCSVMGDEFLQQQVRRMLGTAVAMINEWLPIHRFLDQSVDPAVIIETPILPSTLVYRAGPRFHWNELDGQRLLCFNKGLSHDSENAFMITHDPIHWMHTELSASHQLSERDLNSWFINVRDFVCPRILDQIYNRFEKPRPVWRPSTMLHIRAPPVAYAEVLHILRFIMSNHLWPSTSVARSSVIASSSFHRNTTAAEEFTNPAINGGSFTVTNTKILRKENGPMEQFNYPILKANLLFPELTQAVFELEEWIIASGTSSGTLSQHINDCQPSTTAPFLPQERRLPSTHCAVNCNAQFLPHVDSGRGLGQSTSMIVGLGDYVGGEIVVEQISYQIRYQPLEFDGWNLRHWTNPFAGPDRYSLVWFTPATSATSDQLR